MAWYTCVFQTDEEYEEYERKKKINAVNIELITEPDIKRPKLSDNWSFYIIYSPEKQKRRPRDSALLNLRIKLNLPEKIEAMVGLKLKLDLKQKKRWNTWIRFFKQIFLWYN